MCVCLNLLDRKKTTDVSVFLKNKDFCRGVFDHENKQRIMYLDCGFITNDVAKSAIKSNVPTIFKGLLYPIVPKLQRGLGSPVI